MPPKSKKRPQTRDAASDTETAVDFQKMTVVELRDKCKEMGLPTKGTKDALVKALFGQGDSPKEPPAKLKKEDSINTKIKKEMEKFQTAKPSKGKFKVDEHFPYKTYNVHEDYACMLNQTNINQNNNKFYVIQLLRETPKSSSAFAVFTRWGRVGEAGQQAVAVITSIDKAVNDFKKKFKDKTKNDWDDRHSFVPHSGKYTLLDIDETSDDEDMEEKFQSNKFGNDEVYKGEMYAPCSLDDITKALISLIFDDNMFNQSMQAMELDVKKMPLGKLSKSQIAKGFSALVDIEEAIKAGMPRKKIEELTSSFFTLIPHSFGRRVPPLLDTLELVQIKKDVLLVLSDIELAQCLQKDNKASMKQSKKQLEPHPLDNKYSRLGCKLTPLSEKSEEYKIIQKYVAKTGKSKIQHVWHVDRDGEDARFKKHDGIKERKLLWHGTNVAVVAAILSSGLRIMPHSGGRVGCGIYFASEQNKSAGYVRYAPNGTGIMFLNEVALGKEHTITMDDSSLIAPPKGYDCVVARGSREPDPKQDTILKLNGKPVTVPQGEPIASKFQNSSFYESEYLVYKESQARIRYLLTIKY